MLRTFPMILVIRTVFIELPSGKGSVEKFQLCSDQLSVDIIYWGSRRNPTLEQWLGV